LDWKPPFRAEGSFCGAQICDSPRRPALPGGLAGKPGLLMKEGRGGLLLPGPGHAAGGRVLRALVVEGGTHRGFGAQAPAVMANLNFDADPGRKKAMIRRLHSGGLCKGKWMDRLIPTATRDGGGLFHGSPPTGENLIFGHRAVVALGQGGAAGGRAHAFFPTGRRAARVGASGGRFQFRRPSRALAPPRARRPGIRQSQKQGREVGGPPKIWRPGTSARASPGKKPLVGRRFGWGELSAAG